jgi:hypothetical protein
MAQFDQSRRFELYGSRQNPIVGPDITAAGTIAPTHRIHRCGGATPIDIITPPFEDFAGDIILIPTSAFTWSATASTGGIAVAGTAVVGRALYFVYNPVTGRWYSHAIA